MARTKLQKFNQTHDMDNIIEFDRDDLKKEIKKFTKNKPIILELACGRGEYTVAMAEIFPDKNFIGIDYQGERLWYGATQAKEKKLTNVLFVRTYIDKLTEYFNDQTVDEIWITFADPQPKKEAKRLTSPFFLKQYQKILKPEGFLNLKTDSQLLFEYSLTEFEKFGWNILEVKTDVSLSNENILLDIQTYFETKQRCLGKGINYCKVKLSS